MTRFARLLTPGLCAVAALACGDGPVGSEDLVVHITSTIPDSLVAGDSLRLTAVVTTPGGAVRPGAVVTWQSSDPGTAPVLPGGVVRGLKDGAVTIRAVARGTVDSVTVRVRAGVFEVRLSGLPAAGWLPVGGTAQLVAQAYDAQGRPLAGRSITWTANSAEASVTPTGLVQGLADGAADIQARSAAASARAYFGVRAPVARIQLLPPTLTIAPGESLAVVAAPVGPDGGLIGSRIIPTTWTPTSPGIARLSVQPPRVFSALAQVGGQGAGQTDVTIAAEGVTTTLRVGVAALQLGVPQVGLNVTCALAAAGVVRCWGSNAEGGLGVGDSTDRQTPEAVGGGHQFAGVSVGGISACGWEPGGQAWCWGRGREGQLGTGSLATHQAPALVSGGAAYQQVSVGFLSACGVTQAGGVNCWGSNTNLLLARSDIPQSDIPVAIPGLDSVAQVAVGSWLACARRTRGDVWCWGSGRRGAGQGAGGSAPMLVAGGHTFTAMAVGFWHACGLDQSGQVWCWGENTYGALGDGTTVPANSPVAVTGGHSFTTIAAGLYHTCAVEVGGAGFCWGLNASAQLGDGGRVDQSTPVAVGGGLQFDGIGAGGQHSCGHATSGRIYCWGDALSAVLGTAESPQLVPGRVFGQQ